MLRIIQTSGIPDPTTISKDVKFTSEDIAFLASSSFMTEELILIPEESNIENGCIKESIIAYLLHSQIDVASFSSEPINVELFPINGSIMVHAGTALNHDNGIRLVVKYIQNYKPKHEDIEPVDLECWRSVFDAKDEDLKVFVNSPAKLPQGTLSIYDRNIDVNVPTTPNYGVNCSRCKEHFPDAEFKENFVCYRCKNNF